MLSCQSSWCVCDLFYDPLSFVSFWVATERGGGGELEEKTRLTLPECLNENAPIPPERDLFKLNGLLKDKDLPLLIRLPLVDLFIVAPPDESPGKLRSESFVPELGPAPASIIS
jgi:hypothetical protein